jgi:hypothetical protein
LDLFQLNKDKTVRSTKARRGALPAGFLAFECTFPRHQDFRSRQG